MADDSVKLFNPNDGLTGRDGGPYLDQEEARIAEERRARVEGREPDYDNPGVTAGIPLTTAAQMIHNVNVSSLPSKNRTWVDEAQALYDKAQADDKSSLEPVDSIDKGVVAKMQKADEEHKTTSDDFNPDDPNAPAERVDDVVTSSTSKTHSSSSKSSK